MAMEIERRFLFVFFCRGCAETRDHLLFECSFSERMRQEVMKDVLQISQKSGGGNLLNGI